MSNEQLKRRRAFVSDKEYEELSSQDKKIVSYLSRKDGFGFKKYYDENGACVVVPATEMLINETLLATNKSLHKKLVKYKLMQKEWLQLAGFGLAFGIGYAICNPLVALWLK